MASLYNKNIPRWLYNNKTKAKMTKPKYIILSGKTYWKEKLIIKLINRNLIFQIIYQAYIISLKRYLGQTKTLKKLNKQYHKEKIANNI